jgi:hypothetical protein
MKEKSVKTKFVAYSVNGDPLTRKKYCQELLEAEAEIARGEFTDQKDLEKEAEKW